MTINATSPVPASSDLEEELPKCRICYEETFDRNDPLIRPCKCSGSMRFAHKLCLQKWRMQSSNTSAAYKCLVCKEKYMTTTTSSLRKLYYFFVLPGIESLIYSCTISYVIGYFLSPGEGASRAERATCTPPFTPTRETDLSAPDHPTVQQYTQKVSSRSGVFGRLMETLTRQRTPAPNTKQSVCESKTEPNVARKSSWRGMFRTSKHWSRFFTGQYMCSVMSYTSMELGVALALDRWQFILDLFLFCRFPELVGCLFDYVIFDYAPILERPIQVLFAGKIFFDFARLAKSIYDIVLTEFYIPNYLSNISEVRDLDEVETR